MNDAQRRLWVNNDEGLYDWWQSTHQLQSAFIRSHRRAIDEVIDNILMGRKPSHYLKYERKPRPDER